MARRTNGIGCGDAGMKALAAGSTIGILGGGQLGRMLAIAAAQLGYRVHIYAPEADSVAAEVAAQFTCAAYEDADALMAFAKSCDMITYEFENIPVAAVAPIADAMPVRPSVNALRISQNRVTEKKYVREHGGRVARFAVANSEIAVEGALAEVGVPAILKTIESGYDGKGQVAVSRDTDLSSAWRRTGAKPLIVEAKVQFDAEFSVILVRSGDGEILYWESPRNAHVNGILAQSTLPAGPLIESQRAEARILAAKMAEDMNYVGVMTCEFFATKDGPIVNEIAPRVHNSGHWTIEGAATCQFENHIRAICDLPLGITDMIAERVEMENLIGGDNMGWQKHLTDRAAHLHLYGKAESRNGRKMGHVTRVYR
jgi:5-(carboxyamino)imidazole ribonucleotide synthase